jgi:uncharacterized RDD family membrane protein YckC
MKIQFRCGQCGASVQVDDSHAGKTGKCPKCAQPVKIPSAEAIRAARQKKAPSKAAASTPAARPAPAAAPPPQDDFGLSDLAPRFDDDDFNFESAAATETAISTPPPSAHGLSPTAPKSQMGMAGAWRAQPAGFWKRFFAVIVDAIVFIPIAVVLNFFASGNPDFARMRDLIGALINLLYFAAFESSGYHGTPGKLALGIMVVDTRERPISFVRAIGRNLAKYISTLTLLIGYIMAGFTPKKQALHDMIAGCLVVNR